MVLPCGDGRGGPAGYNAAVPETCMDPIVEGVAARPRDVECDLLVVPVFEDDDLGDLGRIDEATGGEVSRARATREFRPKPNELFVTRAGDAAWKSARVGLVGVGEANAGAVDRLRTACATAARAARRQRAGTIAVLLRGDLDPEQAARAAAEGVLFGSHADRRYKSGDDDELPIRRALVVFPGAATAALEHAVGMGSALGEAANRARELADAPGNVLSPRLFAEQAETLAGASGVAVEVLDEAAIERLRMGLLLGVARGSAEPPRLIVMRHEPADAPPGPVLGLIGKGVTFDSGGISIKPADRMEQMKHDMAGGAAVVCAMRAIGRLAVPTRVIGIVPATENMPGGRATRPGDVLTGASGKTVEVINTDAEGRLILADALWYARELGATHLVDVATLTGSVVVALGHAASGLFGRPRSWVDSVQQAAGRAGERVWPMPLYPEYDEQLRSETADLGNIGGRAGGACTAAAFLKAFAADLPWAHVDIAGTAWADEASAAQPKGATGAMVRTLTELAVAARSW